MDPNQLSALQAQQKAQNDQMKAMMKQMGVEYEQEDNFNEEDEYDKVLKQMGIKASSNENDDIAMLLKGGKEENYEDMDDDTLLNSIMGEVNGTAPNQKAMESPLVKAKRSKEKADKLKDDMKAFMQAGNKQQAAVLLREYKAEMVTYQSIVDQHPDVKAQLEGAPIAKQVEEVKVSHAAAPVK